MNTITNIIAMSALVMWLSGCAHYPNQYSSYPSNEPDYSSSSYGNYQYNQYNYPRQPAPGGYWSGRSRPYGGYNSNNYYNLPQYQNYPPPGYGYQGNRPYAQPRDYGDHHHNHDGWQGHQGHPWPYQNRNQPSRWGQPVIDRHENRSFNTETRDNPPNGGWQRNSDNRQRNWGGGQQGRNNQPQVRQQPVANLPEERRMPQGNRGGQGNGAWVGNRQGNNFNRQQNRGGGWQNQNNPPQPRPQFNQGQNEGRNQKFEATYDRIQQRIYESSGQNRNGQNQKRRKQDNDR